MKKTALLVLLITVAVLFNVEIVKAESGGSLIDKGLLDTSLTVDYGKRRMNMTYYKANLAGIQYEWNKDDIKDLELNETNKYTFTDTTYSAKFTYGIIDYLNLFINIGAISDKYKHEYISAKKSNLGIYGGGGLRGGYKFPMGFYIAGTGMFNMGSVSGYNFGSNIESEQNFYEWEGNLILGYDIQVSQSFRIIPYLGGRYSDRFSKLELLYTNGDSEYAEYRSKTKFGGFGGMEFRFTKQLSAKVEGGLGDKTGIGAALSYRWKIYPLETTPGGEPSIGGGGGDLIEKDLFATALTVDYGKRKMKMDYGKKNVAGTLTVYTKSDITDKNKLKPSFTDSIYSAKFTYGIADWLNVFVNVGTIFDEFKDNAEVGKSETGIYGGGGLRAGFKFPFGLYFAGTGMFNMGRASNYSLQAYSESKNNIYDWEGNVSVGYDIRVSQSFRIIPYLGGRYSDRYSKLELKTSGGDYYYHEYWSKTKFGGFGGAEFRLTKQLSFKAEVGLGDKNGVGAALTYRFGGE